MQKLYSLHSLRKRILAITVVISFLFCSLAVRLFVLQIINSSSLQIKATDQWTRDLAIVAPRGAIYDRTGASLAVSYTTYNVFTRPREITSASETALFLSQVLDLDYEKTYTKIAKKGVSETLIKMQVDGDVAEKIYKQNLSGVYLAENASRYYPYGNLCSQLIGFTSVDNLGQSGIEAYFDEYLTGDDGCSFVQSDLQGKEIGGSLRYYIGATAGDNLNLTIDSKIQLTLEQTLEKIMIEQKSKAVSGLVMKAKTGEVVAMSSKPSFDLNEVPRDDLETLFNQSRVTCVTDNYEPGSTFKILTISAALEEGLTNLNDRFYCPGYRVIDGVRIKCWRSIGHGSQTLTEAFANSCNCCFMDLALRLGKDKFYSYMQKFGLGSKTGISISGEGGGILMNKANVKNVDLARMGFGHAVALTPIQLATAVSSVTNGGNLITPYIVGDIVDVNGNIVKEGQTTIKHTTISQSTSQIVNQLLEHATNKTAPYTFVEGYNVGGKTGTAQKYKEGGGIDVGKYISSFVGTYPANDPEYILVLLVDEPSAGAYYGSIVAAPYGKQVFMGMFEYLGLEKDDTQAIIEYVTMPDLEGSTLLDAALQLKELGLYYELDGEGDIIVRQLPPAGTKIEKGGIIILITN